MAEASASVNSDFEVTSRFVINKASFRWKIENFSCYSAKEDEKFQSPAFQYYNSSWALDLYPNGQKMYNSVGKIGIFLRKLSSDTEEKIVKFKIALKEKNGKNHSCTEIEKIFMNKDSYWGLAAVIDRDVLLFEKKDELLHNDTLTIYCELSVGTSIIHGDVKRPFEAKTATSTDYFAKNATSRLESLSKHLGSLFETHNKSDVTLKMKDQEYPVHKLIICSRSPVFAAMFSHDMKENRSNIIDIKDIDPHVMSSLLVYIYTSKINETRIDKVMALFSAADKYAVEELKRECMKYMLDHLTVENFCDVITCIAMHGDHMPESAAVRFFQENASKILSSNRWKSLKRERPDIASDLLEKMVINCIG